jgi:hypothetical protein
MYQPKFCCECGERILREKWKLWTSRRYCDNCASRYQKKQLIAPILAGAALLGGGLLAGRSMRSEQPPILEKSQLVTLTSTPEKKQNANNRTQDANPQQNVNAQTNLNTQQTSPEQPAYYCGARTQKGMPCMRRVRGAVRCWQHEGKPAMMPQEKLLIKDE